MIASIYKYGSSVLRKKSAEISEKEDFVLLSENLFETLSNSNGIGLAGPQIGVLKRIFVIDTSLITQKDNSIETIKQVYINPSIVWRSEELIVYSEGCLSIPEIYEEVERPERIRVKYHDLQFSSIEKELEGLEARIFQHEFDHLIGVLFIDRINPLKRIQLASKLKKIVKASKK
ncbi:MAG: peptide deformylase [Bacteroidales bacterium]|nr:MAG: peptide deformylase [Bacteroidales bacterium]